MKSSSRSGFSLLEMLLVMGVVGVIGTATAGMLKGMARGISTNRTLADRDRVFDRLTTQMVQAGVLAKSFQMAPGSPLFNCLSPTNTAANCRNGVTSDVVLYDAAGEGAIAGTSASPVYYNLSGRTCAAPDDNCPLALAAKMKPICAGGVATCVNALQIAVTVFVSQATNRIPNSSVKLKEKSFSKTIDAKDIVLLGAQACSTPGQVQTGYDSSGKIVCAYPSATAGSCPPGQYVSGVNYSNSSLTVNCTPLPPPPPPPPSSCPPNQRLVPNGAGGVQCAPLPMPKLKCRIEESGLSGTPAAYCNADETPTGGGYVAKSAADPFSCPGETMPAGGTAFAHFTNMTNDGRGWVVNFLGSGGSPLHAGDTCGKAYAICCRHEWP